jgi:predicted AlkP superfamily pyrophosphatase or phosphodiesterase
MKQLFFSVITSLVLLGCSVAEPVSNSVEVARRPKVIIGITVDQMRYDYIERYWNDFTDGGFKRLVNEGFFCRNLHYNYLPTKTGPGHASIFTGTTPAVHGILANNWYMRSLGRTINCVEDTAVKGLDSDSFYAQRSPVQMLSTTIGDELKLFNNQRSRVFGVSTKDRSAILPAGRTADAAYWLLSENGDFVSSTWYMPELPQWVKDFNAAGKAKAYMNETWNLLHDISVYDESIPDNNAHEIPFEGTLRPVFPYKLSELAAANFNFEVLKEVPQGNSLTIDFAKTLIENESVGKGQFTDMLCVSIISLDNIGHRFGIHSLEMQDGYLRLDKELEEFLNYLDKQYGKDDYLLFLSADHGALPTPSYMQKHNGPFGYWRSSLLEHKIDEVLDKRYGNGDWLSYEINYNVFLNRQLIAEKGLDLKKIQDEVADIVLESPEVQMVFTAHELSKFTGTYKARQMVERGFSPTFSGDVLYVLKTGYMECDIRGGTDHGTGSAHDTHVPAIFYGFGVNKGESFAPYTITDIAPTVTSICKLPMTSGCTGQPIIEVIKK